MRGRKRNKSHELKTEIKVLREDVKNLRGVVKEMQESTWDQMVQVHELIDEYKKYRQREKADAKFVRDLMDWKRGLKEVVENVDPEEMPAKLAEQLPLFEKALDQLLEEKMRANAATE